MGSIIWCARVIHRVEDSRSDVVRAITAVREADSQRAYGDAAVEPPGFIFVTPEGARSQRLLSIEHISSIEAIPGHGV